jgi:steroid delta-isomerase-like uncharacterized protein
MMKIALTLVLLALLACEVDATPNEANTDSFVRDFYAAYSEKNAEKMALFYAADATFVDPSFELNLKGMDEIRALLAKVLAKYEALDWEIAHTTSSGDDLVVEGTMIGKLAAKTVRVPFVSVFHFKDGKIAQQRDMFDVTHFLVQIGAIPEPFGPKPSPAKAEKS